MNHRPLAILLCLATALGAQETWQSHLERPLVYASSQLKYGLYQNYLHRYMDRPLFHDPSLGGREVVTCPSFSRIMRHAADYELDGLGAIIGNSGMIQRYELAMACADQAPEGFLFFPLFGGEAGVDYKLDSLKIAAASPLTARFDGKLRFGTYGADRTPPDQLAAMLAELRQKQDEPFLYLISIGAWREAHEEFHAAGGVRPETDAAMKAHIRSYLDVGDGIDLTYGNHFHRADRTFDAEFYRDYVIPTLKSVLSEPPYQDKWLALGAVIGYFQFMSGSTLDEDGTRTLRHSFEAAAAARPDMIGLAEWDELNEHTTIEPTIANSLSTQRILRYYLRQLKGLAPAPNPGDDPAVPNLIVSFRRALVLGEKLQVELLNVPDGGAGTYTVRPRLLGLTGEAVSEGEAYSFTADRLREHRLTLPSEQFPDEPVLRVELTIEREGLPPLVVRDGLHHLTLRATDNFDYKWVKHPLRDLARPTDAAFELARRDDGRWQVTARYTGDEPLAALEVLENGDELRAFDPHSAQIDRDETMVLRVDLRARARHELKGKMTIEGCPAEFQFETDGRYFFNRGNAVEANMWMGQWRRVFFAHLPRAQVEQGVLNLDFTELKGSVPLAKLARHGVYSEAFDPDIQVTVEDFARQTDIPLHPATPNGELSFPITPRRPNSVFHLRAVTASGKLWRSAPVLIAGDSTTAAAPLTVYSASKEQPVEVPVAGDRIPDLTYEFDPANGSLFPTPGGNPFWGQLGGRAEAVTFVGGGELGGMGDPYRNGALYPPNATTSAPTWVEEDGRPALEFDGVGNFIVFPREVIPRLGPWTLEFEIKPTSPARQILFRHHGHYIGSVTVYLDHGQISTTYVDQHVGTTTQQPGLKLPLGEWSTVRISYDLATTTFEVNGQRSDPLPAPGPGLYLGTSVIGGHGTEDAWFAGRLRAWRVGQRAEL